MPLAAREIESTVRARPASGTAGAGGPIAEMHRTLEHRLGVAQAGLPDHVESALPHRLSRIAGPVLLAWAYVAVALWLF